MVEKRNFLQIEQKSEGWDSEVFNSLKESEKWKKKFRNTDVHLRSADNVAVCYVSRIGLTKASKCSGTTQITNGNSETSMCTICGGLWTTARSSNTKWTATTWTSEIISGTVSWPPESISWKKCRILYPGLGLIWKCKSCVLCIFRWFKPKRKWSNKSNSI